MKDDDNVKSGLMTHEDPCLPTFSSLMSEVPDCILSRQGAHYAGVYVTYMPRVSKCYSATKTTVEHSSFVSFFLRTYEFKALGGTGL